MSGHGRYQPPPDPAEQARKITRLEATTAGHDDRLDRLEETTGELAERLDEADQRDQTREAEVDERFDDLGGDLDEARGVIKELAGRVQRLERRVRTVDDTAPVDLDAASATLRQAAHQAVRSVAARAALLTDIQRQAAENVIQRYDTAVTEHTAARTDALARSRALAATPPTAPGHSRVVAEYRTVRARMVRAAGQTEQGRPGAERARQQLEQDAAIRPEHAKTIMRGEAAGATLWSQLRTRVVDAVSAGALLPVWFTTAHGWAPPAQDPDRWVTAAVDLLAYRITNAVTDPVTALGDRAAAHQADGHRSQWYQELERELRQVWRWP